MHVKPPGKLAVLASSAFVFCFVFNVELARPEGLSLSIVALLIGTLVSLTTGRIALVHEQRLLLSLGLVLPAIFISICQTAFRDSDASTLAALYLKTQAYVYVAGSLYWSLFLRTAGGSPKHRIHFIMASVVWAFSAQAAFVALGFVAPEFRDLVDSLVLAKGNLTGLEEFRFKGLANSGGANLSMAMAFSAAMAAYLAITGSGRFYALLAVLIVGASALVGRSGVLGFAIISVAFVVRGLVNGDIARLRMIGALLLIGCIATLGVTTVGTDFDDKVLFWWDWFAGEAGDSAVDLLGMFYHDYSLTDLLIGKGFFEEELYGSSRTDVGYLKTVFSVGVPAAVLFYAGLLVMYLSGARSFISAAPDKRVAAVFVTLVLFLILFYESKEAMAYQNFTGRLLLFSFLLFAAIAQASARRSLQLRGAA